MSSQHRVLALQAETERLKLLIPAQQSGSEKPQASKGVARYLFAAILISLAAALLTSLFLSGLQTPERRPAVALKEVSL